MAGAQDEIPLMDCYTVWSGQCSSLRRVDVSSVLEYLAKSTDFCASSTIFSLDSGLRAFAKLSLHVLSVKAELDFFFGCTGSLAARAFVQLWRGGAALQWRWAGFSPQ